MEAARGGAHIADVEHPSSALGTPYPLNIKAVRERLNAEGYEQIPISTNIGEDQPIRSMACQAALGVALAGADCIKCGLAGLDPRAAAYLGRNLVRTVREWFPDKRVYPVVFPEEDFAAVLDPLTEGPALANEIDSDGLLIDTYRKDIGRGLLDYFTLDQLHHFVDAMHTLGKEAWLAGSITADQLPDLWRTGMDVVCIRGQAAALSDGPLRFGEIRSDLVHKLVETMP